MPKGKFLNHKGRNRKFTNPEELEEQRMQDEENRRKKAQKKAEGVGSDSNSDSEEDDDDNEEGAKGSGSDSEENSSEEVQKPVEPGKAKGVSGLIEVENPNRVMKKDMKLTTLNETIKEQGKPELSRRQREELERQRGAAAYQKLHAAGATEEARADLARLALVRQQREEAAKRREMEKQKKDAKARSGAR